MKKNEFASRRTVFSLALGLALLGAAGADAAVFTFSNSATITIPGSGTGSALGAPANPYPSTIAVSGLTGPLLDVNVSLFGLSHEFPGDIGILLVGPTGEKALILSDAGGAAAVANLTITLDQDAASGVSQTTLVSGTFQPTNFGSMGDLFPSPAPARAIHLQPRYFRRPECKRRLVALCHRRQLY